LAIGPGIIRIQKYRQNSLKMGFFIKNWQFEKMLGVTDIKTKV
jgi:hypothetical protein